MQIYIKVMQTLLYNLKYHMDKSAYQIIMEELPLNPYAYVALQKTHTDYVFETV